MFHMGWFGNVSVQNWGPRSRTWGGAPGTGWVGPELYVDVARSLERACFDYLVFEDSLQVSDTYGGSRDYALRAAFSAPEHDPLPYLPVIADATSHIGLVGTVSTSFYPPFLAARLAVTLDHVTRGRAGINLVTSSTHQAARNFGQDRHADHDDRYARADEWIRLVRALWESWEPDAVVPDRFAEVYADHTKVHRVDFEGRFFRSRGPLNTVPGPQYRPVVCQAGGSAAGRDLGAAHADTVIALVQGVEAMKAYRADVRARAAATGRDPDSVKVLFIVSPTFGDTDADAWQRRAAADAAQAADPTFLLASMSYFSGIDFAAFDPDLPLPADLVTNGHQSTMADFFAAAADRPLREAAGAYRLVESVRLVGTPDSVAAQMGEVMAEVGGDGFLVTGPVDRHYVAEVADGLGPELARRGLIRDGYTGTTLRDHLLEY